MSDQREVFARLPPAVQAPLLGLVATAIGLSQAEKLTARAALRQADKVLEVMPPGPGMEVADHETARELLRGLDLFLFAAQTVSWPRPDAASPPPLV